MVQECDQGVTRAVCSIQGGLHAAVRYIKALVTSKAYILWLVLTAAVLKDSMLMLLHVITHAQGGVTRWDTRRTPDRTFAAAMFPSWAFLPVSRFVLAFSTVTGTCISAHAVWQLAVC